MKHIIPSDLRYTITLALKKEFLNCSVNQFYNTEQAKNGKICYLITDRNVSISNRLQIITHYIHYHNGLFWYIGWYSCSFSHRGEGNINKIPLSDPDCFIKIKHLTDNSLLDYTTELIKQTKAIKAAKTKAITTTITIVAIIFAIIISILICEYYYYF